MALARKRKFADIDLASIAVARAAADPVGHYSRPDVTRLLLNRAPRRPVEHTTPRTESFDEPATAEAVAAEG